ncbi:glycosyltransferase family A protein [Paenibacillus spongiae]|uniref:Glycosyltransferase family 2 protein n=1 Tax=Paenibacillus spongiae TaxID=2909671 RepID=A0ABY5S563_9BACL|nr:glycosyltransferase family A protein [Paenibacillus spongiae]UVI28628.1 glycosyltransferase family 2 protein [Paenibacillus spongiae]
MDNKKISQPVSAIKQQLQTEDMFNGAEHPPKNEKHPIEVAFAISLKSKLVSRDWEKVQDNLAKTLRSILRNTDQNFRIVIAGHEKPKIEEMKHKRVTWLSVDFPPPKNSNGFSGDKMRKRKAIGVYLRKIKFSGYFMPLDADDWVHYRFVEYIRSQPRSDAFVLRRGLMINLVNKEVWLRRDRFFIGCGSSAVIYMSNEDFPRSSRKEDVRNKFFHMVLKAHTRVIQHLEERNKQYVMIDFPFITWVLAHGDNNSMIKGKKDNGVSASNYGTTGEELKKWIYDYYKVKAK